MQLLGAFAAGFVLRYIIPEGTNSLEHKLEWHRLWLFRATLLRCVRRKDQPLCSASGSTAAYRVYRLTAAYPRSTNFCFSLD